MVHDKLLLYKYLTFVSHRTHTGSKLSLNDIKISQRISESKIDVRSVYDTFIRLNIICGIKLCDNLQILG